MIATLCGPRLEIREAPLEPDGATAWPDDLGERGRPAGRPPEPPGRPRGRDRRRRAGPRRRRPAGRLADPVAAGLLRPVGGLGADVAVGEGQALGTPPRLRWPLRGLVRLQAGAVRAALAARAGSWARATDTEGRRAYVLTLSTREQHIRRAEASSNVCTNQTLIAVTAAIQLAWLGPARPAGAGAALRPGRPLRPGGAAAGIPGVEPAVAGRHALRVRRCARPRRPRWSSSGWPRPASSAVSTSPPTTPSWERPCS